MKVLILAQKTIYSDIIIQRFCQLPEAEVAGLIYSDVLFNAMSILRALKMICKESGFGIILGKFIENIFFPAPRRNYSFPVFRTKDINAKNTLEKIAALKPEVIFSVYFNQIVKQELLSMTKHGIVNIHPSYLPRYRGVGPTFWVLANNEKQTGVTYHFVDSKIDRGDIIKRIGIPVLNSDSIHSLYLRCSQAAAETLPDVLRMFIKGNVTKEQQNEVEATYFGIPNRQGYKKLRKNKRHFITLNDIFYRSDSSKK